MFFDDEPIVTRRRALLKQPPPVPETGWRPPQYYPDLSDAAVIAFDTETEETDFKHGPGWARDKGQICGFSVAAKDRRGNRGKWYFPIRHKYEPEWNLDPVTTLRWLRATLQTPHIPKVGANLLYDVGWLTTENIYVEGELHDIQFAEALLEDQGEVALDYLGVKYLGQGKETSLLYKWCAETYGGDVSGIQRENIYRAPPRLVGPYGEADADMPLDILDKQWPILAREGTLPLYRMECDLIYLLVRMRLAGVQIDVPFAEQLYTELGNDIRTLNDQLHRDSGVRANVNSPGDLAMVFDAVGIKYPRTQRGAPSFQKEFMKSLDHPIANLVNSIREHEKIRSTFVRSYLLESNVKGRIFCQFHPLRGDDGGTITGRFSSSDPNLQNIPVRTKLGKRVRKAFTADPGHIAWEKDDHSQIEYRMLANFASGPGSEELRDTYNRDPKTDYHSVVHDNVLNLTGMDIERRPIKNINFGLIYGQSEKSLGYKAGFKPDQAKAVFHAYHQGAPYVRPTMKAIGAEVQLNGFITTFLGRRVRFNLWEPINDRALALPYDAAIRQYGQMIRRAYEYRGVNYKLQGSAADVLKAGMHKCWRDGVFDVIGVPKLQVHDELDFSVIDDSPVQQEGYAYMRHCLEQAVSCNVPIRVDFGRGKNWGEIE